MKHVVIGANGQIGTCVSQFLTQSGETEIINVDINTPIPEEEFVNLMHICIPYSENFHTEVDKYIIEFQPDRVIIYSTVLPGTTEAVGPFAVHSPVEGRHPNLIGGFLTFTRFVAGPCAEEVAKFFSDRGLNTKTFPDAKVTELGKMLSTTRYGVNLAFAKAENDLCKKFGLSFDDVVLAYQRMYNEGYLKLDEQRFVQPLLTAPDKIGGHCVVPNAKLLTKISDDPMIKRVADFNN
jgi:UDP-N-acetyl-D-mannosaminuronate dehydrogenase